MSWTQLKFGKSYGNRKKETSTTRDSHLHLEVKKVEGEIQIQTKEEELFLERTKYNMYQSWEGESLAL